ncbi:FKBP-type peptidyl-prolyl cis-trans isomerase [soil metagenome]
MHYPHRRGKWNHQQQRIMRTSVLFSVLLLALTISACDSPTASGCDAVPSRVVSTSGDTVQIVSGLRYIDLQVGTGAEARSCSQLEIGFVGRLEDGTVFDSGAFPVTPGARQGLIPGFEQALIGMRVGGTRRAIIPPYLGYGAAGRGAIPPNATLIFDLELRALIE